MPKGFTLVCCEAASSLIRLPVLAANREQRDSILRQSEQHGLGIMPAYPTLINRIPELAKEFSGQEHPQAEDICRRLLTLPVNEYIQSQDNERIFSLFGQHA